MNMFINEEQRLRAGWRVLMQLVLMFFFVGIGNLLIHQLWTSPSRLVLTVGSLIGITGSIWLSAIILDKRSITDYGLCLDMKWVRDFGAGTAIAGLSISSIFVLEWQLNWITVTGYGWETHTTLTFSSAFFQYFLMMVMVGFYEELLSRGYQVLNLNEGLQFKNIGSRGSVFLAVILTSTFFGLLHLNNPSTTLTSTLTIIVAGIVLALPFVITGSLGLSVGLHFGWNFIQGGIWGFPVSGVSFGSPAIHIQQHGQVFWTGGSFGPEAGVVGLMGMAIMLGASFVYMYKADYELTIDELFRKEE